MKTRKSSVKKHIIKRRGHKESFDERKVYASVFSAALSAHYTEKKAELLADKVSKAVNKWIAKKASATAHQVYAQIAKEMYRKDKNAAYMYETHMDIS